MMREMILVEIHIQFFFTMSIFSTCAGNTRTVSFLMKQFVVCCE